MGFKPFVIIIPFFHLSPSQHHSFTWTSLIAIPHSSTLCSRLWIHQLCAQISPLHDALQSPGTTLKLSSIMSDSTYWEWYCPLYIVQLVKQIDKFIFAIYQMKRWNLEPTQKYILPCFFCGQVADTYPDFKSYAISHMMSDFCQVVHMKTKIHINADVQIHSWRNTNHLL